MARNSFHIFSLGDSIIWGQGLTESQKLQGLLVEWVKKFHPAFTVTSSSLAHSGAIIGVDRATDATALDGEIPSALPTILQQCGDFQGDPTSIDLVILNGGINDVGVRTIFNPFTSSDELEQRTRKHCGANLQKLIETALRRFPNPATRIYVTGYYPVLSEQSDIWRIPTILPLFGVALPTFVSPQNPIRQIVQNSLLFWQVSNEAISGAVAAVNGNSPHARVTFVDPGISTSHSAFTDDPWVFAVKANLQPQDPLAEARHKACTDHEPRPLQRELCFRASAGHPNASGAMAYFKAVYPLLQQHYGL